MTQKFPNPVWPYSCARECDWLLYCSGQIGLDPETMKIVKGWVIPETKQVMSNIQWLLENYWLSMMNVIKTTVLLENIDDFAKINEIYSEYFDESKPARSCFAVAALPLWAKIEIEVIAKLNS